MTEGFECTQYLCKVSLISVSNKREKNPHLSGDKCTVNALVQVYRKQHTAELGHSWLTLIKIKLTSRTPEGVAGKNWVCIICVVQDWKTGSCRAGLNEISWAPSDHRTFLWHGGWSCECEIHWQSLMRAQRSAGQDHLQFPALQAVLWGY